ncbi:MAG: hypothetical protein K6G83_05230 [Lachnospiraceae bacterium]|nr:hypothetical protein [Lachnospiraceae bacterium]
MAGMQIRPIADFSVTPTPIQPVRNAENVNPQVPELEKPDKAEEKKEEELQNVVSVSKDGDTVQVSDESAKKLNDDAFGRMDIIGRDEEQIEKNTIESGLTSPEVAKLADTNVLQKNAADRVKDEEKTEDFKIQSEDDKGDAKPQITSYAGYTENQLEQMYLKGDLSKQDYDKAVEAKEKQKEAIKEEDSETTKKLSGLVTMEDQQDKDAEELTDIFGPYTSDTFTEKERADILETLDKTFTGI